MCGRMSFFGGLQVKSGRIEMEWAVEKLFFFLFGGTLPTCILHIGGLVWEIKA